MAGEQNITMAEASPVSVPLVAGVLGAENAAAASMARPSATPPPDFAPYNATSLWRPWPAVAAMVSIMAVSVLIALGGTMLLAVLPVSASMPQSARIMLAMLAAQIIIVLGAVWAAQAKGDSASVALALKAPSGGFWTYAGAMVIVLAAVAAYTVFANVAFGHDPGQDLGDMIEIFRGPWWPLALAVIGAGAPLSEELMFRGFLQTVLAGSRLGYWGAALVTTTIWTALHAGYSLIGLGEVFMIGIIFALFLRRTGSLRVTLVCHAIYNSGIALLMTFAPPDLMGM